MDSHPANSLIPPLDEDDLAVLMHDIQAHGLLQPIVLDRSGRVLDGRGRLTACERLGIEADFVTYDGAGSDIYSLSVNLKRRSFTKGQSAMITVKARATMGYEAGPPSGQEAGPEGGRDTRPEKGPTVRDIEAQLGVARAVIGRANVVWQHAPDLVDSVISGAVGLDRAYETAREKKAQVDSAEAQLARLRKEDPDLATRVVEGELTLQGAWAERKARQEEQTRQRRVATQLLCEVLPSLAQVRGSDTFALYDPQFAPPGRAVTRAVIAHAATALEELATVWKERDLP
ncbi:ParB N-terminal domain-containing protein [Streptomyces sp. ME02-6985-2c]|uniref:ParB N-terminal domain-containing protein n=1 Tax=Streptomyces sp. ME02-6985-2c TaxID=3028675 RepID=UPI0029C020F4|nr:ParB N-terminal domain-containing protein [Streptomyces sp. ME02-6985-2c]